MVNMKYRVGIASSDGLVVNQHFGRATQFLIVDIDEENKMHFVEKRIVPPVCDGGDHNDHKLIMNIEKFVDCHYLLVSRIGRPAEDELNKYYITVFEIPGLIEESIEKMLNYIEIQKMLS